MSTEQRNQRPNTLANQVSPYPDSSSLHSGSTISPLHSRIEAASEFLWHSYSFIDAKCIIEFTPGLDSDTATTLLSNRPKGWLGAFAKFLSPEWTNFDPLLYPAEQIARWIVSLIRGGSSFPTQPYDWSWIYPELMGSRDISLVAENFEKSINSAFWQVAFKDWAAFCDGRQNDASKFLETVYNFRNDLAYYIQTDHAMRDRLESLQKTLPSQQSLTNWIVSTALSSNTSSNPCGILGFLLVPIHEILKDDALGALFIARKLSFLGARFQSKVIVEANTNWQQHFRTDSFFWESFQDTPELAARTVTQSALELFFSASARDLFCETTRNKDIRKKWSDLVEDVLTCLITQEHSTAYFMDFANHLISLKNVYSATAVGNALSKLNFWPCQPSKTWDIINPEDLFASAREYMRNELCLPMIQVYDVEMRSEGGIAQINVLIKLTQCYESQEVGAGQNTTEVGAQDKILIRYPLCYKVQEVVQQSLYLKDNRKSDCSVCQKANKMDMYYNGECELWAFNVCRNYQIFRKGIYQMQGIVPNIRSSHIFLPETSTTPLYVQMVLLSCSHQLTPPRFSKDWTFEQKIAYIQEFTYFVPGRWSQSDVLCLWDGLLESLGHLNKKLACSQQKTTGTSEMSDGLLCEQ